jgi:hypothetical protein
MAPIDRRRLPDWVQDAARCVNDQLIADIVADNRRRPDIHQRESAFPKQDAEPEPTNKSGWVTATPLKPWSADSALKRLDDALEEVDRRRVELARRRAELMREASQAPRPDDKKR